MLSSFPELDSWRGLPRLMRLHYSDGSASSRGRGLVGQARQQCLSHRVGISSTPTAHNERGQRHRTRIDMAGFFLAGGATNFKKKSLTTYLGTKQGSTKA